MERSPLAAKMHLKPGSRLAVVHAPPGYAELLDPLPEGTQLSTDLSGLHDGIWYFSPTRADLERDIAAIRAAAAPGAALWLSYRKGTRKEPSDLKRETLWEIAGPHGLEAVSQVAVDDTWSALRLKAST